MPSHFSVFYLFDSSLLWEQAQAWLESTKGNFPNFVRACVHLILGIGFAWIKTPIGSAICPVVSLYCDWLSLQNKEGAHGIATKTFPFKQF